MCGYSALWLPGTDHAGLATQTKLEELMKKSGIDYTDDEQFYKFSGNYKTNLKSTITNQIRSCGASCDWTREKFTLDDDYSFAVLTAMKKCHENNMIFKKDGQWYLDMSNLASRLLGELDSENIAIHPQGQEGTIRNFLTNIEPWCISRQIKWGHKIPIWIKGTDIQIYSSPIDGYTQIDGCLDTWFSSALWTFATLGYPDKTLDLEKYYPASMIETGSDILFFWCARMLMMGMLLMDSLPFNTIYLHGLILDKDGKKMSKSANNGIDPLKIIEQYGCDAMRYALAESSISGQDMRIWDEKFKAGKSLQNKIWNASKFSLNHWHRIGSPEIKNESKNLHDMEIIKRTENASCSIGDAIKSLNYNIAAQEFRKFFFDDLCGWYIEIAKERLYADDIEAITTLMWCLDKAMRIGHPFMPFITEYIRGFYSDTSLITDIW